MAPQNPFDAGGYMPYSGETPEQAWRGVPYPYPGSFSMSAPGSQVPPTGTAPAATVSPDKLSQQLPVPQPVNVDLRGRLNEMLAPYQQMAAHMQGPYAMFRPDSWLATKHPGIARALDSPLLAAALTPGPQGPEGVGGGISRALQGPLAAQQYRRQQMMQAAMLPYQMLQPRLQAEDVMAQTMERESMARLRPYQELFYQGRLQNYEDMERHRQIQEQQAYEISKTNAQEEQRLAEQAFPAKDPKHPTPEEAIAQAQFIGQLRSARSGGGGTWFERAVQEEDKARVARGLRPYSVEQRNDRIVSLQAQAAGARTGATTQASQNVKLPTEQAQRLEASELKTGEITYNTYEKAAFPTDIMGQLGWMHNNKGPANETWDQMLIRMGKAKSDARVKFEKSKEAYIRGKFSAQGRAFGEMYKPDNTPDLDYWSNQLKSSTAKPVAPATSGATNPY
jgi:hypothetical protein